MNTPNVEQYINNIRINLEIVTQSMKEMMNTSRENTSKFEERIEKLEQDKKELKSIILKLKNKGKKWELRTYI